MNNAHFCYKISILVFCLFVCLFYFVYVFCNAIKDTNVYIHYFLHDFRNLSQEFNNFHDFPKPAKSTL